MPCILSSLRPLRAAIMVAVALMAGCVPEDVDISRRSEILVYCGITMVKPMREIADRIEKDEGVKVTIIQGGSEDLYQSLKASRVGDLYLPGSPAYRKAHLDEGLLGDFVSVGFNRAALIVPRGNPGGIAGDVHEMLRDDVRVVMGDAASGSIGNETKRILTEAGIYKDVLEKISFFATASRSLNRALKDGEADVILNWRATAFFEENIAGMEVVDIDPALARPKELQLMALTFSKYPDIVRKFMDAAVSPAGRATFEKYGFIEK